jgi:hypothetical protein
MLEAAQTHEASAEGHTNGVKGLPLWSTKIGGRDILRHACTAWICTMEKLVRRHSAMPWSMGQKLRNPDDLRVANWVNCAIVRMEPLTIKFSLNRQTTFTVLVDGNKGNKSSFVREFMERNRIVHVLGKKRPRLFAKDGMGME